MHLNLGGSMTCERCSAVMHEEELVVIGGPIKIKNVSAWNCPQCGRIEYRAVAGKPRFVQYDSDAVLRKSEKMIIEIRFPIELKQVGQFRVSCGNCKQSIDVP